MKLALIAAIGKNNELGKDNNLIWRLPNDLKFFKTVTTGKTVVMGRKTFMSLPKILPNRTNVVISHNNNFPKEIVLFHSIEEFLEYYKDSEEEIFIIGGALVYKQFIKYACELYLTEIDAECKDADVYFPVFNKEEWEQEVIGQNEDNGIKYKHVLYKKR